MERRDLTGEMGSPHLLLLIAVLACFVSVFFYFAVLRTDMESHACEARTLSLVIYESQMWTGN